MHWGHPSRSRLAPSSKCDQTLATRVVYYEKEKETTIMLFYSLARWEFPRLYYYRILSVAQSPVTHQ